MLKVIKENMHLVNKQIRKSQQRNSKYTKELNGNLRAKNTKCENKELIQ